MKKRNRLLGRVLPEPNIGWCPRCKMDNTVLSANLYSYEVTIPKKGRITKSEYICDSCRDELRQRWSLKTIYTA